MKNGLFRLYFYTFLIFFIEMNVVVIFFYQSIKSKQLKIGLQKISKMLGETWKDLYYATQQ